MSERSGEVIHPDDKYTARSLAVTTVYPYRVIVNELAHRRLMGRPSPREEVEAEISFCMRANYRWPCSSVEATFRGTSKREPIKCPHCERQNHVSKLPEGGGPCDERCDEIAEAIRAMRERRRGKLSALPMHECDDIGCQGDKYFDLADCKARADEVHELRSPDGGYVQCWLFIQRGGRNGLHVEALLVEHSVTYPDEERTLVRRVFIAQGPALNLRELRHVNFGAPGDDGYCHFPPLWAIARAAEILKADFDGCESYPMEDGRTPPTAAGRDNY